MKRKAIDLSFQNTFLRQFIFSALIPLIALSIALSAYYSSSASQYSSSLYSSMLETTANAMAHSFNELSDISFTPYLYKAAESTVTYMHKGLYRKDALAPDYLNTASSASEYTMLVTKLLHSSSQFIESITFYPLGDFAGDAYAIYRTEAGLQIEEEDAASVNQLYEYTLAQMTEPVFLCLASDGKTFTLLRRIQDFDNGRDLGILRIDTRISSLTDALSAFEISEHSFLVLTDCLGQMVFTLGQVQPELLSNAGGSAPVPYQVKNYHLYTHSLSAQGWQLTYAVSDRDLHASFVGSISIIVAMALLAFVLTFILWRIQSAGTIASIDSILESIRQLRHGNFDHVCTVADKEGYAMIADSLNKTGQRLKDLIEAEASARDSQSRAEYLALQSQINPHFLYNTLNGFAALNRMGERKQLETSILQLTHLFRYICDSGDLSTVSREYQFARQYLELQKLRFGERLDYDIHMEDDAADLSVPKLIVQPIVENCVVHGMDGSGEPVTVSLQAFLSGGCLCMEIQDDGAGFDPAGVENAPHVGLKNVSNRLRVFSPDVEYSVDSAPGQGTRVTIRIPVSDKEGREA